MNPELLAAIRAAEAEAGRPLTDDEVAQVTASLDRPDPERARAAADAARASSASRGTEVAAREGMRRVLPEGVEDWISTLPETIRSSRVPGSGAIADWLGTSNEDQRSEMEARARGAREGVTNGTGDEIGAMLETAASDPGATGRALVSPLTGDAEALGDVRARYRAARGRRAAEDAESAEANPLNYAAGSLVGAVAAPVPFAGPSASLARGASAVVPRLASGGARAIRAGAISAGLTGAGMSESELATDAGGVLGDAARSAAGGAAGGAVLHGAGAVLRAGAAAAPAARRIADRRLLGVPSGSGPAATEFARDLVGGAHPDIGEAAEVARRTGFIGPLSTADEIFEAAERARVETDVTAAERAMAAHPEGGVDPRRMARAISRVVEEYPPGMHNLGRLEQIAASLRARGGVTPRSGPRRPPTVTTMGPAGPVPGFTPGGGRASPAPEEMIGYRPEAAAETALERPAAPGRRPSVSPLPSDPRRTGRLGLPPAARERTPVSGSASGEIAGPRTTPVTPPPDMAPPRPAPDTRTPARRPRARREGEAAPPPSRHDPESFDLAHGLTLPAHLAGDARPMAVEPPSVGYGISGHAPLPGPPGGRSRSGVLPVPPAGLSVVPELRSGTTPVPEVRPPVVRPRGERPLGAREMVGAWDAPPPPIATRVRPGPRPGGVARTIPFSGPGRPPESAMHVLDTLDDAATYRAADPAEPVHAARRARSAVRRLLDERTAAVLGPDAAADAVARRERAATAIALRNAANRTAMREDAGGARRHMGIDLAATAVGAGTGYAAGGVPGAITGAAATGGPLLLGRMLGPRAPALMAAGSHRYARMLESPALRGAAAGSTEAVPLMAGVAGRLGASAGADRPETSRERLARDLFARLGASTEPSAAPDPTTEPAATDAPPGGSPPASSPVPPPAGGATSTTRRRRPDGRSVFERLRAR